jgi:methyltransferase (TIGR00027 family)
VREGKPSRTAQFVALNRALGTLAPRVPGFSDPFAIQFISDKWRKKVERKQRALANGSRKSPYAAWQRAMGTFNQFRTVILDRALTSALPIDQLVILGAGLDSRAWRLTGLQKTTVYEVDFPASQAWKRERSAGIPFQAADVRFVSIDFQRDKLAPLLYGAGFDPARPTFWLWEGVTMYLEPEAVSANLAAFAELSAPGSRIALSYLRKKSGRVPRNFVLALLGEPLRSAFAPEEMAQLAQSRGWRLIQDSNITDWLKETPDIKITPRQIGVQWLESIFVGQAG